MSSNTTLLEPVRPSRRAMVRGAAWTVPVVAVAATAPAYAASPCMSRSSVWNLDWGTSTYTVSKPTTDGVHTGTATVVGPTNSTPITVTFTSTMTRPSNAARRSTENLTVSTDTNIGGLGTNERALNITHDVEIVADRATFRQEIEIKFNRAITGLSFSITDIDTQASNQDQRTWSDRVEFSPNATYSVPTGSDVIGRGINENIPNNQNTNVRGPFRRMANSNIDNTGSNAGNVDVSFASLAANTPIKLTFWTATANGNQRIFVSDMQFTALTC